MTHFLLQEFCYSKTKDKPLLAPNLFSVAEGYETTIERINKTFVDENNVPLYPIRILKTIILVDPFEGDEELNKQFFPNVQKLIPLHSPEPILDGYDSEEEKRKKAERTEQQEAEELKKKEARSRAVVLEILGDIPDAELKAPENVLFVCKLNPVTTDDSLEIIFSRFGKVKSCEIIRDKKTGDSLCYGFVEYESKESCEEAYLKMENVSIDDRRIHVDFSQSVSKLWHKYKKHGKHQDKHSVHDYHHSDDEKEDKKNHHKHHSKSSYHSERRRDDDNKDSYKRKYGDSDRQRRHREHRKRSPSPKRYREHRDYKRSRRSYS